MNISGTSISLRIFSGPHLGADVRLCGGTHLLGAGDSCDIILQDSSIHERHALLEVAFSPGQDHPVVRIRPVDGPVLVHDSPVPEGGTELAPCTPFYLGMTCLAWNEEGKPWESITAQLARQDQSSDKNSDSPPLGNEPLPSIENKVAEMPTNMEGNEAKVTENKRAPGRWLKKIRATVLIFVIIIILVILCFQFVPDSTQYLEDAEYLLLRLEEKGITGVHVTPFANGVLASGVVKDEQERTVIWQMAQEMQVPVQIDVQVRDDLARAIRDSLNAQGLFIAVKVDDTGEASIRGYMENKLIESAALSTVKHDVPNAGNLSRKIVFAEQLAPLLDTAMLNAGLENTSIRYTPGTISITGMLTLEEKGRLEQIFRNLEKQLDIPLRYVLLPPRPKKSTSATNPFKLLDKDSAQDDSGDNEDTGPFRGTRVTGVTMEPMKFITLDNGERIFEGGVLPGGHTLEMISPRELTLRKGNAKTKYELK